MCDTGREGNINVHKHMCDTGGRLSNIYINICVIRGGEGGTGLTYLNELAANLLTGWFD